MQGQQQIIFKERIVCAIFVLLLLFRGGYFYYESFLFLLLGSLIMPFRYFYDSKERRSREKGWQGLPFLYFVFYLFSPIMMAQMMHYYGFFKMFAPFWLVWALVHYYRPRQLLEQFFKAYFIMLVVAFLFQAAQSLLSLAEIGRQLQTEFPFPMFIKGRFTGFMQYANVNAILSLLTGFYAVYCWKNRWATIVCALSLGLSGSRTAWGLGVLLFVTGMAFWIRDRHSRRFLSHLKQGRRIWMYHALFLLVTVLGAIAVNQLTAGNRFQNGVHASELHTRLLYYKDGLQMIMHRPWGYGHYGYYLIQRQFQTGSTYYVKFIHNFLLQIMLDSGIVSATLFMWILVRTVYFLLAKQKRRNHFLGKWVVLCFFVALGHAFLDFDFEFNYFMVLLWIIYFYAQERRDCQRSGSLLIRKVNTEKRQIEVALPRFQKCFFSGQVWMCLLCIALSIVSVEMGSASWNAYNGKYVQAIRYGFTDARIGYILDNRYNAEMRAALAHSMENSILKSVEIFAFLRNYYYNKGMLDKAMDYAEKTVEMAPLWIEHRQELMRIQYAYALTNPHHLEVVAQKILAVPEVLEKLKKFASTDLNVHHRPKWEMTEEMKVWYHHFQKLYNRK